jgi:hypothetical protein
MRRRLCLGESISVRAGCCSRRPRPPRGQPELTLVQRVSIGADANRVLARAMVPLSHRTRNLKHAHPALPAST